MMKKLLTAGLLGLATLGFNAALAHGTVLDGTDRSEAELVAAGDKLEARGVKRASGDKVVAALVTSNAKAITVRFTVK